MVVFAACSAAECYLSNRVESLQVAYHHFYSVLLQWVITKNQKCPLVFLHGFDCSFRMFCLCALLVNDLKRVKGYSLKAMIIRLHDQLLEKMTDYVIAIELLIRHMLDSQ